MFIQLFNNAKKNKKLVVFGIVALICVALLSAYMLIDSQYKQQFAEVYGEVEEIRTKVIEPAGGVEWTNGSYTPKFDGDGWLNTIGCIDINCPSVSRSWLVSISPEGNSAFVQNLMQSVGYVQKNDHEGVKGKLILNVTVNSAESISISSPPEQLPGTVINLVQTKVYLVK